MSLTPPQLPDVARALAVRFPFSVQPTHLHYELGSVVLGRANGAPVVLPRRPRFEHTHVIGTTGGGKTNLLEHCIRQDIKNGDGIFAIDAHGGHPGSLFRSTIAWLFAHGFHKTRTIHLIDPNCTSYTTGFNPLELPDERTSPSVIAGTTLEAFERVWDDENTHSKPTIRRILKGTFAALAELGMTLAEADLLFAHRDNLGIRDLLIRRLTDRYALKVFSDLDELARADRTGLRFRDEVVGPLNRLAEFTSTPAIRRIVGQRHHTIDLRRALDQGHIILVNLNGGDAVSDADCELLGRLLTRFLFFHVKRRTTTRPFWFYLDECQRYLSGDIPSLLAEARKFHTGVVLSHQWQSQLGEPDDQILAAVHNATNVKIGFRVKHPKEAQEIAEAIIPLDLEMPVKTLIKPTVVGQTLRTFRNWGTAEHEARSTAIAVSELETVSLSTSQSMADSVSESEAQSTADTIAASFATGAGTMSFSGSMSGTGSSRASTMTPALGWFDQPTPLADTTGQSFSDAASSGAAASTSSQAGESSGRTSGQTTGSTVGHIASHGTTESLSRSTGTTIIEARMHGTSRSEGETEGLEPIYQDLPSAVHSYQNVLYFAAQQLRSLAAGEAFASFVDNAGMHTAHLSVPRVKPVPISDATFAAIRTLIFSLSPSAITTTSATHLLEQHEAKLLLEAQQVSQLELEADEPADFRIPAKGRTAGETAPGAKNASTSRKGPNHD